MFILIDERNGAPKDDNSNIEVQHGVFNRAEPDLDVIIRIKPDGIFVSEPVGATKTNLLAVVRVKSEPETSLEQAKEQRAARQEDSHATPTHTVSQHLSRVFGDDDGSPREGRLDKRDDFLS